MTNTQLVADAIQRLSPEEMVEFRAWFAEFDAELWDQEFEADVLSGRLDALAAEALEDLRQGRCREL